MKIVHIDDEGWEVEGVRDDLKQLGHEVTPLEWPLAGELPNLDEYDLLVLDCIMAQGSFSDRETKQGFITGVVLHKKLIAKQYPSLPVIMLSALPSDTTERKEAEAYAHKQSRMVYVPKPATIQSLAQAIAEVSQKNKIF